jgi:hypothetical protein
VKHPKILVSACCYEGSIGGFFNLSGVKLENEGMAGSRNKKWGSTTGDDESKEQGCVQDTSYSE